MANVPAKDVKRENLATATVIVPAVKKNAAALNKIKLLQKHQAPHQWGFFLSYPNQELSNIVKSGTHFWQAHKLMVRVGIVFYK